MPNSPGSFLANAWPTWAKLVMGIVVMGLLMGIMDRLAAWMYRKDTGKSFTFARPAEISSYWWGALKIMTVLAWLVGLTLAVGKLLGWLLL